MSRHVGSLLAPTRFDAAEWPSLCPPSEVGQNTAL
jgi:hypothetical protein